MKKFKYFLCFLPALLWSQEIKVQDYVNAFDDVPAFKEKYFEAYPLNPEIEPQEITLVEYEYTLYQTISTEAPYILIADEAISIGMSNELALRLKAEFLDYFEENCEAKIKYKPEMGQFTEWYCAGVSLSMIQDTQVTMLYIKRN